MAVKTSWAAGDVLLAADLTDTFAAKAALAGATYTGTHNFTGATVTGIAAAGLTLITSQSFSGASAVNINSCFSATYDSYLVVVRHKGSVTNSAHLRLRASGTDSSTGYYMGGSYTTWGASLNALAGDNAAQWDGAAATTTTQAVALWWLTYPATADATQMQSLRSNHDSGAQSQGQHTVATAYDGLSLIPSSGTITGQVRVYGLKNS